VTTELDRLFAPHPGHYYHNVTGSFKGHWNFDDSLVKSIDHEFPLPRIRVHNDTEHNITYQRGGTTTLDSSAIGNPDPKERLRDYKEQEGRHNDTILDTRPIYMEDLDAFKGPFQFNRSGTFSFSVKETKATEQVNWVKVLLVMRGCGTTTASGYL